MITRIELFDDLDLNAAFAFVAQVHASLWNNDTIAPLRPHNVIRIVTDAGRKFLETDDHQRE
jgi:hypothetical protein